MRKARYTCFLVFGLWLAGNIAWLSLDQRLPAYDDAGHAIRALEVGTALMQGSWAGLIRSLKEEYPPLAYLVSAPAAWIYPQADLLVGLMDAVFGSLFAISLWRIGCLLGSPWVGVGALGLALAQAHLLNATRLFYLDFPLVAMVTATTWRILVCERQWSLRNASLLGLTLGLGMLTKTAYAGYVLPVVFWLGLRVSGRDSSWTARLIPAAVAVGVATVTASWWYWLSWEKFSAWISRTTWEATWVEHDPSGASLAGWVFYPNFGGWAMLVIAWTVGATLLLWRGPAFSRALIGWTVLGYAGLCLHPNKDVRYVLPLVPLFALGAWWGLAQIRILWARRGLQAVVVLWSLVQVGVLSSARVDAWVGRALSSPRIWAEGSTPWFNRTLVPAGLAAAPMPDEGAAGPVADIVKQIADRQAPREPRVLMLLEDPCQNFQTLRYACILRGVRIRVQTVAFLWTDQGVWNVRLQPWDWDIVITRAAGTPELPVFGMSKYLERNVALLTPWLREMRDRYVLSGRFPVRFTGYPRSPYMVEVYARPAIMWARGGE